jgi:hypothetical protein
MSIRSPLSFDVGEVLCSTEFRITPREVAGWERAQVLGDRDDRPGFRSTLERPPVGGSPVPDGLVLARALEAIERAGSIGGCRFEPTSTGKLRSLARVTVGEPLDAIATIRYRSHRDGQPDHCFLTLTVEIRGDGRKLAEVEFGVEVTAPPQPVVFERLFARAA